MNKLFSFLFIIYSGVLFSQTDTIVVNDYTKVMIATNPEKGEITPITQLEGLTQAGFFFHDVPVGTIKICNDGLTYVWVNGRLLKKIDGCEFFNPDIFYSNINSDTVFISLTSNKAFSNLKCELIRFEELQVIQEEVLLARDPRNPLSEFAIISMVVVLLFFGILVGFYPARMSYIIEKSFTLKVKAYEFINTNFLSAPSLIAASLLSLILGFLVVYLNELLLMGLLEKSESTTDFLFSWIKFSSLFFLTLFIKRLLIDLTSKLFHFKELKNYQLFDFINFHLFFFTLITLFVFVDFVAFPLAESSISSNYLVTFPIVLIMFLGWYSLKFVNHSPRRKLIIISYLCATEIIPAVFLLGWFFK